jgi:hypothetical protein
MRKSGYTKARAAEHDRQLDDIYRVLDDRGYDPEMLPVDGHRPDMRLGTGDYLDVKTGQPNLAIEINSINTYRSIQAKEERTVYIVHAIENQWWVCTLETIKVKQDGKGPLGPRRATGRGSNDDWYLYQPGSVTGTPFDEFFAAPRFETDVGADGIDLVYDPYATTPASTSEQDLLF